MSGIKVGFLTWRDRLDAYRTDRVRSETQLVTDASQLEAELRSITPALTAKETEQTWNGINEALERWKAVTKEGGGYKFKEPYFACLKKIQSNIADAVG